MDFKEEIQRWLAAPMISDGEKKEIKNISEDETESFVRFSSFMEFGTGGLRSKMGLGTSMMNNYTVAHVTEALARILESENEGEKKVLIGHDSRNNSREFALRCAEVLSSHGITVYVFDSLRPTPELSFGVRELGCNAGINITASHNPKEYNGYKLYWSDGSQPTEEIAGRVSSLRDKIDILYGVPSPDKADRSRIHIIGDEIDEKFLSKVENELVYPEIVKKAADRLKVVYTPLNGAGAKSATEIMKRIGLKHIYMVESQMIPDGNFPGLDKPNPEYPASFREGIKVADKVGSDLIIATDPDADRVGVMAKDRDGEFKCISGNQMGALLLEYILKALKEQNKLKPDSFAVKTIVSTELASEVCRAYGVKMYNVLTGFKYIAEIVNNEEKKNNSNFLLGFEESYGYMKGLYSRDKDSIVATMLICELASYYSLRDMTLLDALNEIYEKYGYYTEDTSEIYKDTPDGKEIISSMMEKLRSDFASAEGEDRIVSFEDYKEGICTDFITGKKSSTSLPKSNVLSYTLQSGAKILVRPSGTEPKIKFYVLSVGKDREEAEKRLLMCKTRLEDVLGLEKGSLKK